MLSRSKAGTGYGPGTGQQGVIRGLVNAYMTVYDFSVSRLTGVEQRVPDAYPIINAGGHDLLASYRTEPGRIDHLWMLHAHDLNRRL